MHSVHLGKSEEPLEPPSGLCTERSIQFRRRGRDQRRGFLGPHSSSLLPCSELTGFHTGRRLIPAPEQTRSLRSHLLPRSAPVSAKHVAARGRRHDCASTSGEERGESDDDLDREQNARSKTSCPCKQYAQWPNSFWGFHSQSENVARGSTEKSRPRLRLEMSEKAGANISRLKDEVNKRKTRSQHIRRHVPARRVSQSSLTSRSREAVSSYLKAYESTALSSFFSVKLRSRRVSPPSKTPTSSHDRGSPVITAEPFWASRESSNEKTTPSRLQKSGSLSVVQGDLALWKKSAERAASAPALPLQSRLSCKQKHAPGRAFTHDAWRHQSVNSAALSVGTGAGAPSVSTSEDEEATCFQSSTDDPIANLYNSELTAVSGRVSERGREMDSCELLFAAQEKRVDLSLEQFDNPDAHGDLPPQEWVRRCISRRKKACQLDPHSPTSSTEGNPSIAHYPAYGGNTHGSVSVQGSSEGFAALPRLSSSEAAPSSTATDEDSYPLRMARVLRHRSSELGENKAHSGAYISKAESEEDAYIYNYERGGWCWTKCRVLQYLETEKRFRIQLLEGGREKQVSRPALRFVEEDETQSEQRIEMCRKRKEQMRLRQSLINTIRSLPEEGFQQMPARTRQLLLLRVIVRNGNSSERARHAKLLRRLLWELEDLYKFAMKFSSIKHKKISLNGTPYAFLMPSVQMEDRFGRLFEALLPARVKRSGCKTLPSTTRHFCQTVALLKKNFIFQRASVSQLIWKVNTRYFEIKDFRFLDVNRGRNRKHFLPGIMYRANHRMTNGDPAVCSLDKFIRHQRDHCSDVKDALAEHWIEFVQNEIMATVGAMGKACLFYTDDLEKHLESNLHKILRRIHLMLSQQMTEFINTSITEWKNFFLSFLEDGKHVVPEPLLIVSVAATGDSVSLVPPPEELPGQVSSLLEWVVEQANSIKGIEKELLPFLKIPQLPLYEVSSGYAPLVEAKMCVEHVFHSCVEAVDQLLSYLRNIANMLTDCAADMQLDSTSVAQFRDKLQKINYVIFTVRSIRSSHLRFGVLAVDCAMALGSLLSRAETIWKLTCEKLSRHITSEVAQVIAVWEDLHTRILLIPADEAELSALKQLIATLNAHTDPLVSRLKAIHEFIDLLAEFGYPIDEPTHVKAFNAYGWPLQIKFDMLETTSILEQGKLRAKLERDKKKLEAELAEYEIALEFIEEKMVDVDQAMEYNKKILQLKHNLSVACITVEQLAKAEALFGVEPSDYSRVHNLISAFDPLRQLWSLAVDFKYAEHQWMNCPITTLDPEEIETSLDSWYREAYKLERDFMAADKGKQVTVTDSLRKAVESFRRRLPLIISLCNGAFQPRHWSDLLRAINSPLEIDEGFSFLQLLESGIQDHMELVEEKSELAQKEFGLKNALLKMQSEWKATQVALLDYKQTGVYVIKGFDVVQQLLDEHLVRTQSMRSSKYIKCVEHQSREWENKLLDVQQLFVSLEDFQRSFMYLHPIFQSEDLSRQVAEETDVFKDVESRWSGIMQQAHESPGPLEIAEIENISHYVFDSNAKCARILRALSDYLEIKRLAFPRFFLLSNDELLDILSQTKNPEAIQPHLNKCFEGVYTVSLTQDLTSLESVCSFEGEEIKLIRPVSLGEAGNWKKAESWLGEVEVCLSDTVRNTIERAANVYAVSERPKWCLSWPEQVVLTVSQLFWTSEVTEAIEQESLDLYLNKCNGQLQELVKLVRGPLSELQRLTATTLLASDVHARDVVEELRGKGTLRVTDFEWLAQMRYFWQQPDSVTLPTGARNKKPELKVDMMHAHLFYGFEYLGNTERLVVTPLTDRCYRTLITAFHLQYGGAPEGPAGTGKTETVKNLAKVAGRQCLVFNCSDGLDYLSIGRLFKGLTSSGAWGCFDEFNRIEVDVLSVVAQQIHSIQQAIRNQAKVFVFEGTDIKLAPFCTINVTMNPGYAGRSELPDNLKALFRPCAMMVPDFFLIAEVYLYSSGFANARSVARKVLSCLKLSSYQLSAELHYDFGMRSLKAILRVAASLKQTYGDRASEDALALLATEKTTLGKLTPADSRVFAGLVSDLFLGVERVDEESTLLREHLKHFAAAKGLQGTEGFLTKCIQLWDTVQNRHGLMLLGPALSGKTSVLECLSGALESLSKVSADYDPCTTYSINPKSLTLEQLYGKYDASTQEWNDGIVALTTRTATQENNDRRKWIIFDGPVDANWIENMNTVLDDNKKLCLTSGEIIKLSPLMTMVFEMEDLSSGSPATVSRCGMVYLDQNVLGWKPLLQSWIQTHLAPTHSAQVPFVHNIAEHAVPIFFEFLRTNCETPVHASENWLLLSLLRLYGAFVNSTNFHPQKETKNGKELQYFTENLFLSTIIWTMGANVAETSRAKFSTFLRKFIAGNQDLANEFNILEAPYQPRELAHSIPNADTVYDYFFDGSAWIPIAKLVPQLTLPEGANVHNILVPTVDTTRNVLFVQAAVRGGLHILLAGPTGTGKTKIIASQLKSGFDKQKFTALTVCLSAKSTANDIQDVIDAKVDRSDGGIYKAIRKRRCLIFLDDINLPPRDACGSQPVIELIRQCLSSGGWYDRTNWRFKQRKCCQFLAAVSSPGRDTCSFSQRFLRHYNMLYMGPLPHSSLDAVFQTLLRLHVTKFSLEIQNVVADVSRCLVELHERVCANLISTLSKPHYVFGLRDLTRVTVGLRAISVESLRSSNDLFKCWIHESERIYCDRLTCREDKEAFRAWVREALNQHSRKKYEELLPDDQPLLFCNFVGAQKAVYRSYTFMDVKEAAEYFLQEYNKINVKRPLNLVFFTQAVKHLARTVRILCQPGGHALLIGLGGSGRKTLTKLAAFIAGHDLCLVEPAVSYNLANWREDLKNILVKTGCHLRQVTFMLTDTDLECEDYLHDAASVLSSGEVSNIFTLEDKVRLPRSETLGPRCGSSLCHTKQVHPYRQRNRLCNLPQQPSVALNVFSEEGSLNVGHTVNLSTRITPLQQSRKAESFLRKLSVAPHGHVTTSVFNAALQIGICDIISHGAETGPDTDGCSVSPPADPSRTNSANSSVEVAEPEEFFSQFVANCQQHLHIVLLFSPSGATFRQRLQTYPALVKCCTMDWFSPWSRSALQDVAEAYLTLASPGEKAEPPKLSRVCAEMQLNVSAITDCFHQDVKRFYYVTPTSYREFLNIFEELSSKKREAIQKKQKQLSAGLQKLESASVQVAKIREDLEILKPQLKQASVEVASLMSSIANMQKEAAAKKAIVQAEEAVCDQQAKNAAQVREQCHEELQQAMPALLVAIEALKKLSKADITELNSLKSPPAGVVKVIVALCKMFNISPIKVKGLDGFSKVDDYWTAAKKHLLSDTRLLQRLFSYDRDNIPLEMMRDIAPYLKDPDFNPDVIRKASVAATSLCKWVRAIIVYNQVAKNVEPKKAALRSAEAVLASAAKNLENKKAELREVEALVENLLNEQRAAQTKKDSLKRQFDECNAKLQLSEGLLRDLASERDRWTESSDALKERTETFLGELLLTSGIVAYGGVFTCGYRQQLIASWFQSIAAGDIPVPANFDLQTALSDPLQIQQWVCNLLPNDSASIENAIILLHSKRWPMLIDPQQQATKWLKKSNPSMKALRPSDKKYFSQLRTAIEMGLFVFLECCSDTLDPALTPILDRAVFKTGNINLIRLEEINVEYSPEFKLYLATNLPNPHFTPEACAGLTLLNFSVTLEGLEDQLLNTILALEHPDVEAKRQVLLAESATNKQQLIALEEKILQLLSNAKGNVLDDVELLGALSSSKLAAQGISNRVVELEKTQEVMHVTRAGYQSIANRAGRVYAVLVDLGFVEGMYQFSAEWYVGIFTQAIQNVKMTASGASGLHLRLEQLYKQFLVLLYDNVCRSLFARHKLVFSLMLAFKVIELSGQLNSKHLQLLLKGGVTSSGASSQKSPQTDWLPDAAWERLVELEEAGEVFENISADLNASPQEWEAFFGESDPRKLEWPHSLQDRLNELERCLVIQALRPDCLLKCLKNLVEDCLGREFLEPPPFDLLYSYKFTTCSRPLLFMLTSGADPLDEILRLAQAQRTKNRLSCVSLGQGQEQRAAAGQVHLTLMHTWLRRHPSEPELQTACFAPSSPFTPRSCYQNSVKVTNEVPRGLRQNLQRTYRSFDSKFVNEHPKGEVWKKLLFALSFFHALVTERRRFGPLGWNVSYEFSLSDFSISIQQLRQLLSDLNPVPWGMLKYLTAEINYGGRIIDPWDRRLINCIVEDIYNPRILEEGYQLCEAEELTVVIPSLLTVENYLTFIGELPNSESPEYNTLHPNADLTVAIAEASNVLDSILSSKPRNTGKESSWSFADPVEIARVIEEQLPVSLEFRAAQRRYTALFEETLLPVLIQELTRYDRLLSAIHKHLKAYQAAVEGKALLTCTLEEFETSLITNRVPHVISAVAYPSSKSLSSWVKDLLERLDFFRTWLSSGPPSMFWISAFFSPQSFLTAVLQRHARDTEVPVDEIEFDFEVLPSFASTEEDVDKADIGSHIYGLYMDGARWSFEEQIVTEPYTRILYYEMPVVWLKPIKSAQKATEAHVYECPVYRTPARAGSLSTSGTSTNFILAINLPIDPRREPRYWTKRGVALLAQLND